MFDADKKILWKFNSTIHDWSADDVLKQFISVIVDGGLISDIAWVKVGGAAALDGVIPLADCSEWLIEQRRNTQGRTELEFGADDWSIFIDIYPYDHAAQRVIGINTVWFTFGFEKLNTQDKRSCLVNLFSGFHNSGNTEYAVMHPYLHWHQFSDEHYESPITIAPLFNGVFWLNFLGKKHMAEFDRHKLNAVPVCQARFLNDGGLFIVAFDDLRPDFVDDAVYEKELLRLNHLFKHAIKPDSAWYLP